MATFYIDPSATYNGDGTSPNPASSIGGVGSKNRWAFTIASNNTYLQRVGLARPIYVDTGISAASVSGSSWDGSNLLTINTSTRHGLSIHSRITITGTGGYSGTKDVVQIISSTSFVVSGVSSSGTISSYAPISNYLFLTGVTNVVFGNYSLAGDTDSYAAIDASLFEAGNTGGIHIRDSSNIQVTGFKVYGMGKASASGNYSYSDNRVSNSSGILAIRSTGLSISGNHCYQNISGITVWCPTTAGEYSNLSISNNIVDNNVNSGISVFAGGSSGAVVASNLSGVTISNNIVTNTGVGLWDPKDNGIAGLTDSASPWLAGPPNGPVGGIFIESFYNNPGDINLSYAIKKSAITGNSVYNNMGYGIKATCMVDSLISGNQVSRSGVSFDGLSLQGRYDTHSLWIAGCTNTVIEKNTVYYNGAALNGSYGSGVGIFLDQHLTNVAQYANPGKNNVVRQNFVYQQSQLTTAAYLPSSGIMSYMNSNCDIYSNIISNCRQGITTLGASVSNGTAKAGYEVKLSALSGDGTTATATVSLVGGASGANSHGIKEGDLISVTGVTVVTGLNTSSPARVLSVPSASTFTYASSGSGAGTVTSAQLVTYVISSGRVFSNTVMSSSDVGIGIGGYSTDYQVTSNVITGCTWGLFVKTSGTGIAQAVNVTTDGNVFNNQNTYLYTTGDYTASSSNQPGQGQSAFTLTAPITTNYIIPVLPDSYGKIPNASTFGRRSILSPVVVDFTGEFFDKTDSCGAVK